MNPLNSKLTNVTTGTVTWISDNVTGDATRCNWWKYGRVVVVSIEFTPISGQISNGNEICSGLPTPTGQNERIFVTGGNAQQIALTLSGKLVWYFPSDTSTVRRTEVNLVYISAS